MTSETNIEQEDDEFHPEDTAAWKLIWVVVFFITAQWFISFKEISE